jgi:hypothetical protein
MFDEGSSLVIVVAEVKATLLRALAALLACAVGGKMNPNSATFQGIHSAKPIHAIRNVSAAPTVSTTDSCKGKKAFVVLRVLAIAQIALAYLFDGLHQAVSLSRILSMSTTPSVILDGAD